MKVVKYALAALAALAVICAALVAYLVLTFDPRDHEPRIVELVKQKTGRTLRIKGEIALSFWPDLGVRLGAVSLSERDSGEPFADVGNARLTVKLLPLLSRELVADEIVIQDAHLRLTRFADGHLNVDDLLESEGDALRIDIGRVKLERSALTYRDLASGSGYDLSAIEFETGRISDAQSTPMTLAMRVGNSPQSFDVLTTVKGRMTLDSTRRRYALDDAAIAVKGHAAGVTELVARAKGSFALGMSERDVSATQVSVSMTGVLDAQAVEATLESPLMAFGPAGSHGDAMAVSVRISGAAGTTRVSLKLPRLDYAADTLKVDDAAAEIALERGGRLVRATLRSPAELGVTARVLRLTDIRSSFSASGAGVPRAGISGVLSGTAGADLEKQTLQAALAGRVGDSRLKAALTSTGFATPAYTFAVELDQLDLDRYAVTDAKQNKAAGIDLSDIEALPATGTLRIGVLKAAGVRARNVRLAVKP